MGTSRGALRRIAPLLYRRPLSILNKEAADLQKEGHPLRAVAAYNKLFRKVKERNVIHAELYTCHSNRASAYLQVKLLWPLARHPHGPPSNIVGLI